VGSRGSPYRPGQHPNSRRALEEHGAHEGEIRNPSGKNGWESTRRIREAFGEALMREVGEGKTLLDLLVARAVHFAAKGTSRELYELLRYVAPPATKAEVELDVREDPQVDVEELTRQLNKLAERRRRMGPHGDEPYGTTDEAKGNGAA